MRYIRFVKSNVRFLSFGFLLAFISTFGQTFYIAMYSGELRAAFELSHGDFGTVYAIGTVASGLLIIWLGKMIDRFDLRFYALALCGAMAVACLTLSLAHGIIMLTFAIFLLRISGQGLLSQAATVTMARYFPKNQRGRAVSIAALGFPSGQAVFPVASVSLLGILVWREAWLYSACVLVVLIPPLILLLLKGQGRRHAELLKHTRQVSAQAADGSHRQWTRSQVLRDPRFWLAMTAMLAPAFIITGLNFHQVHLVEVKGWQLSVYASAFAVYATCQVGMSVITGMLVDRFGTLRLTPIYMLPMVVSTFVVAGFDHPSAIFAFMILAGTSGGAAATIVSTAWAELYGVLHLGSIKAMVAGLQVMASALGPPVFGVFIDSGVSIEVISAVCGAYALGGCITLAAIFQPRLLRFWRS